MKIIILSLISATLLFSSSQEAEKKLQNVVDMQVTHTDRIERRISKITTELERKSKEREEKAKLREAKIKNLDENLKQKAILREKASRK